MLIKEQIKIARLIASGTPRETAILEFVPSPGYGKKTAAPSDEPSPQAKAKKRAEDAKKKQDELKSALKQNKEDRKKLRDDKKIENLRRDSQVIRNKIADRVKDTPYSRVKLSGVGKLSKANTVSVTTKGDKSATATQQAVGNLARVGAAGTKNVAKIGFAGAKNVAKVGTAAVKNVAKGTAKAVVGARDLKRGLKDRAMQKEKIQLKKDKILLKQRLRREKLRNEEFIQEVEDKKDSKAKKVIDIMRGKNSIKINPDVKENTVVVQDASGKDFVEIVDIISPQKVRSDWRKEINVTEASAAWQRKEGKSKSGGLNEKGRKSYERQNPGSDLKAPSKKVGNKRRASFCARMKGMKKKLTSAKTARDPNSRINKSLRAWNC